MKKGNIKYMMSQDIKDLILHPGVKEIVPKTLCYKDIHSVQGNIVKDIYEVWFAYKRKPNFIFCLKFINASVVTWGCECNEENAINESIIQSCANWITDYRHVLGDYFKTICLTTKLPILMQGAREE